MNNPSVHCNKSPLDGHLFPFKFKSPSSCSKWFGSSCATRCNWLIIHDYKLQQLPDNFQLKWPSVDFNVTRRSTLLTLASRTKVIQRHFCVKCHVTASSQWMLLGSLSLLLFGGYPWDKLCRFVSRLLVSRYRFCLITANISRNNAL